MDIKLRINNYIQRYAPSEKKLRRYISMKSYTYDIGVFLKEIHYDESLMCTLWIKSFIGDHKSIIEIRVKLLKKGFPPLLIEEKIGLYRDEIENWESQKPGIELKIDALLSRGKSKKYIAQLLQSKYPYFKESIMEVLIEKGEDEGLKKEFSRYCNKYDISESTQRQKIISSLIRKGFNFKDIKILINQNGE